MEKRIQCDVLQSQVKEIFAAAGVPEHRADVLARCLVEADARGTASHGVIRTPVYLRRIREGLTEVSAEIESIRNYPSTALLDGKNVIGQVAGEQAMLLAIEKARQTGVACVGLKGTNHFGTCGHYSAMAVPENMIGISFVNTTPLVAVHGGTQKAVGNNPLSIAIPAGTHCPIVLDMACSVAQGKIEVALKKGQNIPGDWAIDENGNPTTDAAAALKGVLLPIAGAKGSGLAIVIDILCGILTGSGVGAEIRHLNDPAPQNLGALFLAIDVSKFVDVQEFLSRVDGYIDYLKGTAKAGQTIWMPGEIEYRNQAENLIQGVALPEKVVEELNALACSCGLDRRL